MVVDHFYSQLCEPRAVTVDGNIGNGELGAVSLSLSPPERRIIGMPRESESEAPVSVRHGQVKLCTGRRSSNTLCFTIDHDRAVLMVLDLPRDTKACVCNSALNSWSLCRGIANCSSSPHRTPHQAERK